MESLKCQGVFRTMQLIHCASSMPVWHKRNLSHVHRLFKQLLGGAGTIDEKIYQRQLMKGQIADMMEGQGGAQGKKAGAGSRFSVEELKELFKLRLDTPSDTHDLLCKGSAATGMS